MMLCDFFEEMEIFTSLLTTDEDWWCFNFFLLINNTISLYDCSRCPPPIYMLTDAISIICNPPMVDPCLCCILFFKNVRGEIIVTGGAIGSYALNISSCAVSIATSNDHRFNLALATVKARCFCLPLTFGLEFKSC